MARPETKFFYNYQDIAKMTGQSANSVYQHKCRGAFDPEKIETVFLYVAAHGRPELQVALVDRALRISRSDGDERPKKGRKKRG